MNIPFNSFLFHQPPSCHMRVNFLVNLIVYCNIDRMPWCFKDQLLLCHLWCQNGNAVSITLLYNIATTRDG